MRLNATRITEATPEMCRHINRLLQDLTTRPITMTSDRLAMLLACRESFLFMAYQDGSGDPVGMFTLAVTHLPSGNNVWLEDVVIDRQHQGQGCGRQLLGLAVEQARRICPGGKLMLTSRPSRLAANHLYAELFDRKETNVYSLQLT